MGICQKCNEPKYMYYLYIYIYSILNIIIHFNFSDHFRGLSIFHSDLNFLVLPKNPPKLSGSSDTKCDCGWQLSKQNLLDPG